MDVRAAIRDELTRRGQTTSSSRYQQDPAGWVRDVLGEYLWSKQRTIAKALVHDRKVAVKSCHSAGKSFLAGRLCAWFLSAFPPQTARIITTAPTGSQVKGVLWQEIHAAVRKGQLPGRVNQTEWWIDDYMAGIGRKPADMDMAGFQGFHAEHLLVVFDEADGMPGPLWDAADSLLASGDAYWLAIGNPYTPESRFAEVCKPGSGWKVITITAWDTPNFTEEDVPDQVRRVLLSRDYVADKERRWSRSNPLWLSKIEAEFPEQSDDALIPVSWVRQAQERSLEPIGPRELGMDVGGGVDKTIIVERRGPVARVIVDRTTPDTMHAAGELENALASTGATAAKIDEIGIGRGVVDRLLEKGLRQVVGINVGRHAEDREQFANLRAEGFWNLREQFRAGAVDLDPEDDDLAAQLVQLKWKRTSHGIQIEAKDRMKARGLSSPDRADALMLAFLAPGQEFGTDRFLSLPDW